MVSPNPSPLFDVALVFRSDAFCDNVHAQVHQGQTHLRTQHFRRLIVNESMRLASDWLKAVIPAGEPLRLSIINP